MEPTAPAPTPTKTVPNRGPCPARCSIDGDTGLKCKDKKAPKPPPEQNDLPTPTSESSTVPAQTSETATPTNKSQKTSQAPRGATVLHSIIDFGINLFFPKSEPKSEPKTEPKSEPKSEPKKSEPKSEPKSGSDDDDYDNECNRQGQKRRKVGNSDEDSYVPTYDDEDDDKDETINEDEAIHIPPTLPPTNLTACGKRKLGTHAETIRQQMDVHVRSKLTSCKPHVESLMKMSMPKARTDNFTGDRTRDVTAKWPHNVNGMISYKEQKPNNDGQNNECNAPPEVVIWCPSKFSADYLQSKMEQIKPRFVHSFEEFENTWKSKSGMEKSEKTAAVAAKGGTKAAAKGGTKAAAKGGTKAAAKGGTKAAAKGGDGTKAAAKGGMKTATSKKRKSRSCNARKTKKLK